MEIVDQREDPVRISSNRGLALDAEGVGFHYGKEEEGGEQSGDNNCDGEHGILRFLALDIYVDINILGPCQSESAASGQFPRGSVLARPSNLPTRSATPACACMSSAPRGRWRGASTRCCGRLGSRAGSFRC